MSYRNTPNIKKIISSHNTKLLKSENSEPPCNCKKNPCPLPGQCRLKSVIYQATVTTQQNPPKTETYVGMTSREFKERFSGHKTSIDNMEYKTATTLSQHIWNLKEKNINYNLTWKIIDRAQPFSPISGVCNLCTLEKYYILFKPGTGTLNKREELFNYCMHKKRLLLDKT